MTATEEPLEPENPDPEDEDAPQGPVSVRYRHRRYAGDRVLLPKLLQWFIPLPNRPKRAPLDRSELRAREPGIRLDAAEQLLDEAKTVWNSRQDRIHSA
jgi:hypothetical protein